MYTALLLAALTMTTAVIPADNEDLPAKYRRWLEEDAAYIISEDEKAIFHQFETDEQRDRFIAEFWLERDPSPGTERNEFREEHYRRVAYADEFLGRETGRRGSKTDRGRIYILLGEPREIRRYHSTEQLVPLEMWFYEADPALGVPPFFYMIFFKRFAVGDYILYDPSVHGPDALIFLSAGESFDEAAEKIEGIDPELARASISLVPTEMASIGENYKPSLSSIMLMSRIENIRNHRRSAEYAKRILSGQPRIETLYMFDSRELLSSFDVFKLSGGDSTLWYSFFFPAEGLEYGKHDDTVYASLEVLLSVTDEAGTVVAGDRRVLDLEIPTEEMRAFTQGGIAYEDQLMLLPGDYRISLLVRNRITRVFFSSQAEITVPGYRAEGLAITGPLVCDRSERNQRVSAAAVPPYAYLDLKYHPALSNKIPVGQELGVIYQLHSQPADIDVAFRLLDAGGTAALESSGKIAGSQFNELGTATAMLKLHTDELAPGSYRLEIVATRGEEQAKAVSRPFTLASAAGSVAPMTTYGNILDFTGSGPTLNKARQLLALGRTDLAIGLLQSAARSWPGDDEVALMLAEALGDGGRREEAIDVLVELSLRQTNNADVKRRLGSLNLQIGNFNRSIGYFEQALLLEEDSVDLRNKLGEAYRLSGNVDKAIENWSRSLELDPQQPLIAGRLAELQAERQR